MQEEIEIRTIQKGGSNTLDISFPKKFCEKMKLTAKSGVALKLTYDEKLQDWVVIVYNQNTILQALNVKLVK